MHGTRKGRHVSPENPAGKMVRAVALHDAEKMQEAVALLNASSGWENAISIFDEAFKLAAEEMFSTTHDIRVISRWVREAAPQEKEDRHLMPLMEAEAMIRRALGEDIDTSDIPGRTVGNIRFLVIEGIARDSRWTKDEIDAFVVEAEKRARACGFQPTFV